MNLLEPQDWTFPVPIAYGPGRLREIGERCVADGMKSPLVVTDRGSRGLPFIDHIGQYLRNAGLSSAVFADISSNPRDTEITLGRERYREGGHGGSGMDGGKAIAAVANNDIALWAFEYERIPPDMTHQPPFPPLICIPTTAGTGAETEGTAMITEVARMMKLWTWHPELKPCCALLDPAPLVKERDNTPSERSIGGVNLARRRHEGKR